VGVVWLAEATAGRELLGGKGASLAALRRAGLPVPDGFVVPPEAAAAAAAGDRPTRAAIEVAWKKLAPAAEPLAVRSSAIDEDGVTASFAGQFETVLGVRSREELFAAIERCVASASAQHAESYRERMGSVGGGMAVIVQRLVAARAAGVVFTCDPATADASRIVVEAVPGLGDRLVSGAEAGERWTVSRAGDVVERPSLPGALDDHEAAEAARLALAAEEAFGTPVDVEFAVDAAGRIWLLQARPITAMGSPPGGFEFDTEASEEDEWTSANVQEVLPGLLTPLTITLFEETSHEAYTRNYQRLRILRAQEWPRFVGVFGYRAFLNVRALRTVAERTPGGDPEALEHRYLGGSGERRRLPFRTRLGLAAHRLRSATPLLAAFLRLERAVEQLERDVARWEKAFRALDPASLSDAELERWRQRALLFAARRFHIHLDVSGLAGSAFDAVGRLLRPVLGADTESTLPTLFTGLREVESARIALDTWELAEAARACGLEALLRDGAVRDPLSPELPQPWREAVLRFLERHGHRAVNEMEASAVTWRRDPAPVLAMVRSYLDLPAEQAPPAVLARQQEARLRLTAEVEGRMPPLQRALFRWLLPRAQRWVALRERTKSLVVRQARLADYLAPEIARRLVSRGVIDREDDVYFLTNLEVSELLLGAARRDYRSLVARRRAERERARYLEYPERFRGQPAPRPPTPPNDALELQGTPVSAGFAVGRARVILDPERDGPLEPGEILVAPVTDAGWTPLFALAGGMVVDIGSALSHGSTVAREYGLPAVTNVRVGTRLIRTGDLVEVDGRSGRVRILERAGDSAP
jgi:phosphohistidine swiveling domain-containing protein